MALRKVVSYRHYFSTYTLFCLTNMSTNDRESDHHQSDNPNPDVSKWPYVPHGDEEDK